MASLLARARCQLWLLFLLSSCAIATAFGATDELDKTRPCGCLLEEVTPKGQRSWACTGNDELTQLHACFVKAPDTAPYRLTLRNFTTDHGLALGSADFTARLEHLSLKDCGFKELNLEGASSLVSLDLASNQLQGIDKAWFMPLTKLERLNISYNKLTSLPPDLTHGITTLTSLDLSHNLFAELRASWFGPSPHLRHLNVSLNQLKAMAVSDEEATVLWGGHLSALQTLFLSHNQLRSATGLELLRELNTLRLDHNRLTVLPPFANNTWMVHYHLAGNPWHCDEHFAERRYSWLSSLREVDKHREGPELHDVNVTLCASPPRWKSRSPFLFGFDLCERCVCNVSSSLVVDVNCTGHDLEELPAELPLRTRVLRLANNRIKSLMPPSTGHGWDSLLMLDVHGNEISSIDQVVSTRALRSLVGLNLTNNRLSRLASHVLQQLSSHSMDDLRLSGNPWLCTCESISFVSWLQDNKKVKDVEEIRCSDGSVNSLAGKAMYALRKPDLCPQPTNWTQGLLDALSILMAMAIVAILAKLSRDYWRQKRTGKLPTFFSFV
ncbi:protein halfway-like [Amblyomma americanum]